MGRHRKSGKQGRKPDDYFSAGPFEFARFGKFIVGKSHATAAELAVAQAKMAGEYSTVVADIDSLVASIAGQIAHLPPDRLLQRAWWEYAAIVLGVGDKKFNESDQLAAARMVDYVQSVTYTSPADDLSAHLESLRNLLQAPARQGSRLVDYIESAPEVPIYDDWHNEIGRLRRSDFRHVTVCAVTLDPFTSFAARAQLMRRRNILERYWLAQEKPVVHSLSSSMITTIDWRRSISSTWV